MSSINEQYFEWMSDIVCGKKYSKQISYNKLLFHLHGIEFEYSIPNDKNRAKDGLDLRRRFAYFCGDDTLASYINGPCSVLEMMVALSVRCEESIMDDPAVGDRTGQWFWGMIVNLGLGSMTDAQFDKNFVDKIITNFLNHNYEPNGRGGLFKVERCNKDLRTAEIWYQMCWYLNAFV